MNTYIVNEIRTKCSQIRERGIKDTDMRRILQAYKNVFELCRISKTEGLLDLEAAIAGFRVGSATERFLAWVIGLVVDGVDCKNVEKYGIYRSAAFDLPDYDGLILVMYLEGALLIQEGVSQREIDNCLFSMCPNEISDYIIEKTMTKIKEDPYESVKK